MAVGRTVPNIEADEDQKLRAGVGDTDPVKNGTQVVGHDSVANPIQTCTKDDQDQ